MTERQTDVQTDRDGRTDGRTTRKHNVPPVIPDRQTDRGHFNNSSPRPLARREIITTQKYLIYDKHIANIYLGTLHSLQSITSAS